MDILKPIVGGIILSEQILSYYILVRKNKDYFNPVLFTFIFIYLPFVLSFFNLSFYQVEEIHTYVHIIMISSSTVILFFSIIYTNCNRIRYEITIKKNIGILNIITLIFIITYLSENLIMSNTLIPILKPNIGNIHIGGIKGFREINFVLRTLVPILNFYLYDNTKDRKYLGYTIIALIIPLTRGSRNALMFNIIAIVSYKYRSINAKKMYKTILVGIIIAILFINIGNQRISEYETSNEYGQLVGITSDKLNNSSIGEYISWYYGYYSLSFYNFNITLKNWLKDPVYYRGIANTYGLFTTIIPIKKIIANYPTQEDINSKLIYVSGAANVPTALYYYLVDFGVSGTILFEFLFYGLLFCVYKKSIKFKFYRMLYSILLINVVTFVFYSSFYAAALYPTLAFLAVFRIIGHKKYII